MNYFMGEFTKNSEKKDSELKRWTIGGSIGGSIGGLGTKFGIDLYRKRLSEKIKSNNNRSDKIQKIYEQLNYDNPSAKANMRKKMFDLHHKSEDLTRKINLSKLNNKFNVGLGVVGGLTAYGAYRGGKALINKLQNHNKKRGN